MKNSFDEKIVRVGTDSIKYDVIKKRYGRDDLTPLWVADMDFRSPQYIVDDLILYASKGVFGYTYISDDVFQSVIDWQSRRNNYKLEQSEIIFSPSVMASISVAINAFSEIGDSVIIQTPVYPPFASVVKDNNRELKTNPLQIVDKRYEIDFKGLEALIDEKTKILLLCSPHNPIGRVWSKWELEQLGELALKHNLIIISDEIHSDFVFSEFTPFGSLEQYKNNLVVLNSPTKTFNLAGLKISYAIISEKTLHEKFKTALHNLHINEINSFAPIALKSAYEKGDEWVDEINVYLKTNVDYAKEYLTSELPKLKIFEVEATYLLWIDFNGFGLKHKEVWELLLDKAKVLLNDGTTFGKCGYGYFRLNAALPLQELKIALERIVGVFKED